MNYLNNKKGQSLVELASFGSILLLCLAMLLQYGMHANYQQNTVMQSFRKAMKTAFYKSGPGATVSMTTIKDKGIPDPNDPWGFADRTPISGGGAVTWDSNTNALYIDDYDEIPVDSDLPLQIIEINDTLGLTDRELADGAIEGINYSHGAFTTADYRESVCGGSIMVVFEKTPVERAADLEQFKERWVACNQIFVQNRTSPDEEPDKKFAYFREGAGKPKHKISSADLDYDGQQEMIIAVRGTQEGTGDCDANGYCGRIQSFKYVDYQEGELDNRYLAVSTWEHDKDRDFDGELLDEQQGLLNAYTLVKENRNNYLTKTEDDSTISSFTNVYARQRATHIIRLNKPNGWSRVNPAYGLIIDPVHTTTEFSPDNEKFTWEARK
ncbi:hypothetical protein ACFL1D_00030 [Candidatus Omnitrophota bacterium]